VLSIRVVFDFMGVFCNYDALMRRYFILSGFLIIAPIVFFFTFFFYLFVSFHAEPQAHDGVMFRHERPVSYAALPTLENSFTDEVVPEDARVEMVRQFLARYHSPLEEHAALIVNMAEKYDLDYRLIPAIAMQESNLCKKIPAGSHNCWGFGIYGDKITRFTDYPEAIETVSRTLGDKYKEDHGLVTAEEIMSMYTPHSNGSWASGVNYFIDSMQ
jgi:hypothetical protein